MVQVPARVRTADPADPHGMVEACTDSRDRDEGDEHREGRRAGDQERRGTEVRDSDRKEPRGVPPVRDPSEGNLRNERDEERRGDEEAGLGVAEAEVGAEDGDLARHDRHRCIVRQMVDAVREQDPPVRRHPRREPTGR